MVWEKIVIKMKKLKLVESVTVPINLVSAKQPLEKNLLMESSALGVDVVGTEVTFETLNPQPSDLGSTHLTYLKYLPDDRSLIMIK